ncbi:glycoside hydrolase domain-containing protein [Nocardioides terrisoli]|uniref:glycoside hydrolase domain-containing protein n=1 Tax=Nocardioides terrisoli TaxID=3388267 RepID=UPI00287BAFF1|nr:glycoside hydrolase domain-containing protein [Nocardioides marmorisolisilvae]
MLPRRHLLALAGTIALVTALLVQGAAESAPHRVAANPRTPGNFTGKGFDQCNAPSQYAMDRWRAKSPYRAVGIYISGNSRYCRDQPNLNATWVTNQLQNGWHLLPITLGPQASCQPRFPRYGANVDPTIDPHSAYTYAAARRQAQTEAATAVATAKSLGIVPGSTLFYDIEAFDLNSSTGCTESAKWFLSTWSNTLHRNGYLSGVYSSAGSAIMMLDQVRQNPPAGYVLPDLIWLARWNGRASTSATHYLSNTGWADHQRVKQYQGGHDETWGGVTINIDRDYLDVRNGPVPPARAELPMGPPPGSFADPRCTSASINLPRYRRTNGQVNTAQIVPAQCLLKQRGLYTGPVTGRWTTKTVKALHRFQRSVHHPTRNRVSRSDWVALITAGASDTVLSKGSRGPDVVRVQRAMNAAAKPTLKITGKYNWYTRRAVTAYQKKVIGPSTGVTATLTWGALHQGKR